MAFEVVEESSLTALKQSLSQKAAILEAEVIEEDSDDDDEEGTYYFYDEDDFCRAMDLLKASMNLLGFLSDKNLSGNIVKSDRKRMEAVAEDILKFTHSVTMEED